MSSSSRRSSRFFMLLRCYQTPGPSPIDASRGEPLYNPQGFLTRLKPMPDNASRPASAALPDTPRSDTEWGADKSLPRALLSVLALDDFEEPARRYLPRERRG